MSFVAGQLLEDAIAAAGADEIDQRRVDLELVVADVPAFGWAIGLDRLAMVLQQVKGEAPATAPALLIPLGERAATEALKLARTLWDAGVALQLETRGGALKKAMASANRLGIQTVLILGDGELDGGTITVKHMATGEQETWPMGEVGKRLFQ